MYETPGNARVNSRSRSSRTKFSRQADKAPAAGMNESPNKNGGRVPGRRKKERVIEEKSQFHFHEKKDLLTIWVGMRA